MLNIKEETDKFVIFADIPGVKPEDIEVSMEAGVLTVKGKKNNHNYMIVDSQVDENLQWSIRNESWIWKRQYSNLCKG